MKVTILLFTIFLANGDMADDKVLYETRFTEPTIQGLTWLNQPAQFQSNATENGGLRVVLDAKTDFWRKTYYQPVLIKDNGHLLHYPVKLEDKVVFETKFTLSPGQNFDQAGLMVRFDNEYWLKTGIESVDGASRLSCVVTNDFSDWSTEAWPSNELTIRVFKLKADIVVEADFPQRNKADFFRIARLQLTGNPDILVGLFACAPTDAGGSVLFHYFNVKETQGYNHTNQ